MTDKKKILLLKYGAFAIEWGLVFWLVEGNFWLKFFLGYALTQVTYLSLDFAPRLGYLERFTSISDNQLVSVSASVDRLVEDEISPKKISDLEDRIKELERQLEAKPSYFRS